MKKDKLEKKTKKIMIDFDTDDIHLISEDLTILFYREMKRFHKSIDVKRQIVDLNKAIAHNKSVYSMKKGEYPSNFQLNWVTTEGNN